MWSLTLWFERVGTTEIERFLPDHDHFFPPNIAWLRLHQLLNLLLFDPRLLPSTDIDTDGQKAVPGVLRGLKSIDQAVVRKQVLRDEDLQRIMDDILSDLANDQCGREHVDLFGWIYEHRKKYLQRGKRHLLENSSAVFAWQNFFPPKEGSP